VIPRPLRGAGSACVAAPVAAEGENLPHEIRCPGTRLQDGVQGFGSGMIVAQGHFGQFRVAINGRQDVVEVMRNAAGERAHGFHFLRLSKLFLELFFPGDISCNAGQTVNRAFGIQHRQARS